MRYQIWNKTDNIITPTGAIFTPAKWIERFPMAQELDIIIGGGRINGNVCMEYTSTVDMYEHMGCDFTGCETQQDYLDAIEAFEDEMNTVDTSVVTTEERTASALEALVLMNMPDEE